MTINSEIRKVGPFIGNGTATAFPFTFKVFQASDLEVVKLDVATNVETVLTLTANYTVTLNADQDSNPGGTVTLVGGALESGYTLTLTSDVPYLQPTDLTNQGGFYPDVINDALDRATIQIQQLGVDVNRSIKVAVSSDVNTELPVPNANDLLGWDSTGTSLTNVDPSTLATVVAYATAYADVFIGDGVTTSWTLTRPAGSLYNLDVSIQGVTQEPVRDYTMSGTTITFTTAPFDTHRVLVKYKEGLPTVTADSQDVRYLPAGTGAVATTVQSKLRETVSVKDFGAVGDGSDETTKVQYALDALPTAGGTVYVNPGVKFNLKNLTFPPKCNLQYYADSDTSNPGSFGDIASNELVYFSANSSYPADPSGAEVNEWRYTAPFHPGVVIDVRKDVTGADAWFRPGQNRLNPARASYNIMDEQTQVWSNLYQTYETNSTFSGVYTGGTLNKISLNGIGTAAWPTTPSVGNAVYGTTSGAQGFVISVGASETIVRWFKGKFVAGETVLWIAPGPTTITSTTTIVSTTLITTPFPSLTQDLNKGVWAIGLPPNVPEESFTAGGRIVSTNTRTMGQYVYKTITEPGYGFIDSYEAVTPKGRWMIAESTNDFKRVVLRAVDATTNVGQVGACGAHVSFNNAATVSSSNFNVASITRNGTGDYTITFDNAFERADYTVALSTSAPLDFAYVYAKNTGTLQIKVVQTGTSTAKDLTGLLGVSCFGGDI